MHNQNLDCTIIILSYNNADIIDNCLNHSKTSISKAEKIFHNKINIIVVDNCSTDNSLSIIKKHTKVKLITNTKNYGAAGGNNIGMRQAKTPYILLLNSDTLLQEDTLTQVFFHIQAHPKCAVLCVKLKFGDGSFQAFGGFLPSPLRTAIWAFGLESVPLINKLIHPIYEYDPKFYEKEQYLEWCATSFFFLNKQIFEQTGGLDEGIFIHMEDVEWCQRIKDKGYQLHYIPGATTIHLGGKSTKKFSPTVLLSQHLNGMAYFHTKHYHKLWPITRSALLLGMELRSLFYLLTGNTKKTQAYNQALRLLK